MKDETKIWLDYSKENPESSKILENKDCKKSNTPDFTMASHGVFL